MKIFKKIFNNKYILILIGGILISIATVSAAIIVSSNEVSISSTSTTKTNLHDAIEELYGLVVGNSCPYGQTCIRCGAGSYADQTNMVCSSCIAGTYSTGGVNSCLTCPNGYTSDASASSQSECYIQTTAGKFIEIANTSVQLDCPAGSYCPSAKINYGSVGQAIECPSGYTSDSGSTKESDCYMETTAGKYIANAGDSTQTNCPAGSYCSGSVKVNYGSTGGISGCPSGYGNSAASSTAASSCYLTTTAGKYVATANQGETACTSGGYCPGSVTVNYGSTGGRTECPSGYGNSPASATAQSQCYLSTSSGKYVATAKQGETACTSGGYCPGSVTVNYGGTGGRSDCPSGYGNSPASATAQSQCYLSTSSGKYVATANQAETACTSGGYCPGSVKVNYGSTGGRTECPSGYGNSADSSTSESDCYVRTTAGKYIKNAYDTAQTTCEANSYCEITNVYYGSTGGMEACPNGYTKSAAGANSISKCYVTTTGGNYIKTANATTQTKCPANSYCPSADIYYGSTGKITSCGSGKISAAGSSSSSDCKSSTYTYSKTGSNGFSAVYTCDRSTGTAKITRCSYNGTYGSGDCGSGCGDSSTYTACACSTSTSYDFRLTSVCAVGDYDQGYFVYGGGLSEFESCS